MQAITPILLAVAVFLVLLPLAPLAERIPAWVRAVIAIGPAVFFIYRAIAFPSVLSVVSGVVIGILPLWILVQARSRR
jgi:hypothetical protein